ncbi:hypothetical protein Fcan01_04242 [Folsomia candida]|uniref:Uncharacterized protein n=1 Tax=Folsomia candida TaxID=158441 RepID=A0A226ETN6_FOLCA|nr:hypothetical protein Fcan01_04242 [Folsomia candida]
MKKSTTNANLTLSPPPEKNRPSVKPSKKALRPPPNTHPVSQSVSKTTPSTNGVTPNLRPHQVKVVVDTASTPLLTRPSTARRKPPPSPNPTNSSIEVVEEQNFPVPLLHEKPVQKSLTAGANDLSTKSSRGLTTHSYPTNRSGQTPLFSPLNTKTLPLTFPPVRLPVSHTPELMDLTMPSISRSSSHAPITKIQDKKSMVVLNPPPQSLGNVRNASRNYNPAWAKASKKDKTLFSIEEPRLKKKTPTLKFVTPQEALAKERTELDMVAVLDACRSYDETPIWLCFRLWDYSENLQQLKKFVNLGNVECRGDEIADMKKLFDFHDMSSCLDCFMLDEECNMRNVGYIIDDDVLISFNNILPYMTQYFVELKDRFYGKCPAQNALIRQWINYCVRNVRGRRVSEYMWDEMDHHLGENGFFGGTYRTMADTLMYVSLYNRMVSTGR